MYGIVIFFLTLVISTLCASSPPSGAITVGPGGKYSTLTAALADTSSSVYFIYATSIKERVVITRSGITIYGQTSNALTYSSNTVTITNNIPASTAGSNEASATISIKSTATDVKIYNMNIANTYGQGSQAIALSVAGTRFGGYGLKVTGYQDTLLANEGLEFFGKSYISGATDFIFGSRASLWITGSTIETVGNGWITASGRSSEDAAYYIIDKSTITGTGTQYLGRPWRNYARVIFQNSVLGSHIQAAGWTQWSTSTPNTDHILFGEYNNSGSGAWKTGRASFATKLTAGISMSTAFGGSTSWVDSAYL
ncbi:carbohydrate esterase family 8 protein [Ceratobasidium sp. AG-I]|nr:carbohydrate esterase family 8 protein [Ceratobasidium sp. AG-I]